jgi:hypothetical protein
MAISVYPDVLTTRSPRFARDDKKNMWPPRTLDPLNPWTLFLFNSFFYPFPDYICLAEGDACVIGRDFVVDEH